MNRIYLFALVLAVLATGCKKEEKPEPSLPPVELPPVKQDVWPLRVGFEWEYYYERFHPGGERDTVYLKYRKVTGKTEYNGNTYYQIDNGNKYYRVIDTFTVEEYDGSGTAIIFTKAKGVNKLELVGERNRAGWKILNYVWGAYDSIGVGINHFAYEIIINPQGDTVRNTSTSYDQGGGPILIDSWYKDPKDNGPHKHYEKYIMYHFFNAE